MELDFSGLNNIASGSPYKGATRDFSTKGEQTPAEAVKPLETAQRAPEGQEVEGLAQIRLQREQEDRKKASEMYGAYQTNIKRAGQLRTDIRKGVRAGEAPQALFLKAVECIALMTGEKLFYDQTLADLKAIWGEGFLNPLPLEWELGDIEERIANMEQALKRESTGTEDRERIKSALRAHYKKQKELKALLEAGKTA